MKPANPSDLLVAVLQRGCSRNLPDRRTNGSTYLVPTNYGLYSDRLARYPSMVHPLRLNKCFSKARSQLDNLRIVDHDLLNLREAQKATDDQPAIDFSNEVVLARLYDTFTITQILRLVQILRAPLPENWLEEFPDQPLGPEGMELWKGLDQPAVDEIMGNATRDHVTTGMFGDWRLGDPEDGNPRRFLDPPLPPLARLRTSSQEEYISEVPYRMLSHKWFEDEENDRLYVSLPPDSRRRWANEWMALPQRPWQLVWFWENMYCWRSTKNVGKLPFLHGNLRKEFFALDLKTRGQVAEYVYRIYRTPFDKARTANPSKQEPDLRWSS